MHPQREFDFGPESLGPVAVTKEPLPCGTLTSAQAAKILADHKVKVTVRDRGRGGGRDLQCVGRSGNLASARLAALEVIEANGRAGGRKAPLDQHVQRVADR
eukprot:5684792-Pyramimonas_sp.AAC.1